VLVAVKAAGINPGEAAIREGKLAEQFRAEFPSGPGNDFAGVVDEVGSDVSDVSVGDEVLGWSERRSSHAEFVVVPAGQVVPKPAGLAWEVAGSLYVAGVTAWVAVDAVGALQGDTLAVPAAAGGVGSISVQLLRLRGATVIGIASPPHHDWLVSVGVLPVAYDDRDGLADRIRDAAPGMVDAFIDTYGREYVELAVTLGVEPSRIDTIISFDAAERYGAKTQGSQAAAEPAAMLRQLADLAASGRCSSRSPLSTRARRPVTHSPSSRLVTPAARSPCSRPREAG
jgi:NADPH:quinone reductase-like Zn-dependent oxidoreductase